MVNVNENAEKRELALSVDVLLVTVTEVEGRAVLGWFKHELDRDFKRHPIGNNTYFDLGSIGGARVMMVQSEMGAGGPGGSQLVVHEAIKELSPSAVIMVGIAFGFDQAKQSIGNVLVSQQLLGYELQKIGKEPDGTLKVILRGDRPRASTRLLDRFRGGIFDWEGPKVEFGLVLSGEKLVDHQDFREELHTFAPEAIGGEMEGTGLYSAAQREKVDWILVKAICDWADTKHKDKEYRQKLAAENAVAFTMHVLQQGGFVEEHPSNATNPVTSPPTLPQGTPLLTYNTHTSYVVAVAWEPHGSRIASAGGDGTVQVWEAETGHSLQTYRGHPWLFAQVNWPPTIYAIAWSPEGLRLASAGDGSNVFVWNATTGQTLSIYQAHTGLLPNIFTFTWSPDGKYIASACSSAGLDQTIHLWDANTGMTVRQLDAHHAVINFSVSVIAWSPDGSRIVAACGDKTIRIWNAETGRHIATYKIGTSYVYGIAWSPDNRRVALARADAVAQVVDTLTGDVTLIYRGHGEKVRDIAWSPDGHSIATASNDKTIQLWEPITGNRIYTYRGHDRSTTSVAWSPDGTRIASGSNDKTVQVWQAQ